MCGFVGFVGGTDNQSEVLTKMMDRIVHRGPDMGDQFAELSDDDGELPF